MVVVGDDCDLDFGVGEFVGELVGFVVEIFV